ncbi:hypothetical protein HY642_03015 [Candidatus Woesearchaeota archaeon]|nr:hypothetical protein [Candidatus Woesearchaeota archaeon]
MKKRVMSRRAADVPSAGGASTLIALLTLFIIFYIVFIPPEERRRLLEDNETTTGVIVSRAAANVTLLTASVGRLDALKEQTVDHRVPNFLLQESRQARVLEKFNAFTISAGIFSKDTRQFSFPVADPAVVENALLSFDALTHKGSIVVRLNNNPIFEGALQQTTVAPIALRKEYLQKNNVLEFEVPARGLAFWKSNEYSLSNIQIVADIAEPAKQQAKNVFTIAKDEAANLESSYLQFVPVCDPEKVGILTVLLNEKTVLEAVPDCDSTNRQELFIEDMREGQNTLQFRTTKGTYRVEQVILHTTLKKTKSYIDFFEVNSTNMRAVQNKTKHVTLEIKFVDDKEEKRGELVINGHSSAIDLEKRETVFTKDLSQFVQEGNNYVELKPIEPLLVVRLDVRLT